jgi:hypothetical protein
LAHCNFTDPLSARDNGEGKVLIDAFAGWWENARIVCLRRERFLLVALG